MTLDQLGADAIGLARTRLFRDAAALTGCGDVELVAFRAAIGRDAEVEVDLRGGLQRDGAVGVTLTVQLRHGVDVDVDQDVGDIDACTSVVAPGASTTVEVVLFDDDGCRLAAECAVEHG